MHWLVLYGFARACMNPKPSLYMQNSMHWLVLYGFARACMNPKPSLYMQSSMHWLVLYGFARALYESKAFAIHAALASPGVARTLY